MKNHVLWFSIPISVSLKENNWGIKMIDRKKLKNSNINDGKEFVMPMPTVKSYEKYLSDMADKEESDENDTNANKIMLVSLLQEVDESVSISTIDDMHPMDFQIFMDELGKVYDDGGEMSGDDKKN